MGSNIPFSASAQRTLTISAPTPYPYLTYEKNSPQFDPRIFPGCILWLDGADPLATGTPPTSGTNITTWYDKSYSSNNFTVTPSGTTPAQAFLDGSYPTVSWTSNYTNGMVSASSVTLSANSSIFVVWKSTNATLLHDLLQLGSNTTTDFGLRVNWTGQAAATPNFTVTNSNDAFYNNVTNSSTVFYLNGTSRVNNTYSVLSSYNVANGYLNTASTAFTTPTNIVIGYTTAFTGRNYSGYIGEIILYQTAITETQRQQVEAYLANKWGINPNLSSTNRYAPGSYLTFVNPPRIPALPMRRAVQSNKFIPTQISGCQLWLDGADINGNGSAFSVGGTISTWVDKSSLGNNMTGTSVTYTYDSTYGVNGPTFNGSSSVFNQANSGLYSLNNVSTWTVFTVNRRINSSAIYAVYNAKSPGSGQNNYLIYRYAVGAGAQWYLGDTTGSYITFSGATDGITTLTSQTSGTAQGFINGSSMGTGSTSSSSGQATFTIGLQTGAYMYGFIFEVLVYNRGLSTPEQQQIEGYLAWKWRLKASLGSGHPFFLIPPLPVP